MGLSRNRVKSLINRNFLNSLTEMGFHKTKDRRGCYKIRGPFIDVVSVQIGSDPGSLYLHYFTNLLADRLTSSLLNSKTLGARLQGNESGDKGWFSDSEDGVTEILDKMLAAVKSDALPFFETNSTLAKYRKTLEHSMSLNAPLYPFGYLITLCLDNDLENAKNVLATIHTEILKDEYFNFENDNDDARMIGDMESLETALSNNSVEQLLSKWVELNIEKYSLKR